MLRQFRKSQTGEEQEYLKAGGEAGYPGEAINELVKRIVLKPE